MQRRPVREAVHFVPFAESARVRQEWAASLYAVREAGMTDARKELNSEAVESPDIEGQRDPADYDEPDYGPVVGSPEHDEVMAKAGYERRDLPGGAIAYSKVLVP
jgi:hypothetical protein